MLVHVGLDESVESDDLFNELDEFIMSADLEELENGKEVVEEGREKDMDEELRELLGEEVGLGIECLGIDIDKITSDNLEDFLNVVDNPDPNEKIEQGERSSKEQVKAISTRSGFGYGDEEEQNGNEKVAGLGTTAPQSSPLRRSGRSGLPFSFVDQLGATQSLPVRRIDLPDPENDPEVDLEVQNQVGDDPIVQSKVKELKMNENTPLKAYESRILKKEGDAEKEMERKPPEWSEVQGIQDFIDKLIIYLSCRNNESFGKVGEASFYDLEKGCKSVCIYVGYLMMVLIFANTKTWNDARVKFFEKFLVSMETCEVDNICLYVCFDTMK